jgi:hypothetical protein
MKNERTFVWWFVVVFFIVAVFVIIKTENSFGGGDTFSHYKIAHWAWKHPFLLLDHWGKPLFTLLISPWAQLGMKGARLYNEVMGLLTAVLIWKLSARFSAELRWLAPVLVVFSPIYFISMFTSLTEVTFSFFLVLSLVLFFRDKMIGSAVVLSFLPFVRTEGVVLFALFITAYVMRKHYLAILFLFTGFVVYSLAGFFYYHDFWWVLNQNPYSGGAAAIYGHGSLFHFITKMPKILGYPLILLFLTGIGVMLIRWIKKDRLKPGDSFYFLLLIPGSFLLYLAAHSFVWWKGMGNSLGLIRVMAAVTPVASLTAFVGLENLLKRLSKFPALFKIVLSSAFMVWIIVVGVNTYPMNFHLSPTEKLLNQAADFIHQNQLDRQKLYYFDPYLAYRLGVDPYSDKISQWYPKGEDAIAQLPVGAIVVWDAHFGPNEGGAPLEMLLHAKALKQLKVFRPRYPFKVLGGYDYAIYVFQKQ